MEEAKKLLLFLSMFDLTNSKLEQIMKTLSDKASIKSFLSDKRMEVFLTQDKLKRIKELYDENRLKNYIKNLAAKNIQILTIYDQEYPNKLKNLPDAPMLLFCQGDISLLSKPVIAIVGSRKPTNYGRYVTEKFARVLAKEGVVIVSGLAYGIDSISHRSCLEAKGKTIAVLGGGLEEIYPSEHISLAHEIAQEGLLISEYPPNKRATKYTFPARNRIIAGLSDGVLITEASLSSGTHHTRDFALDYGRNLYSVPGNIDSSLSELTNEIIKSGQGMCVTSPYDILKDSSMQILKEGKQDKKEELTKEEQQIVSLLKDGIRDLEYLAKNCNMSINIFNSHLTTLEIRGIISRLPGGFVILN